MYHSPKLLMRACPSRRKKISAQRTYCFLYDSTYQCPPTPQCCLGCCILNCFHSRLVLYVVFRGGRIFVCTEFFAARRAGNLPGTVTISSNAGRSVRPELVISMHGGTLVTHQYIDIIQFFNATLSYSKGLQAIEAHLRSPLLNSSYTCHHMPCIRHDHHAFVEPKRTVASAM